MDIHDALEMLAMQAAYRNTVAVAPGHSFTIFGEDEIEILNERGVKDWTLAGLKRIVHSYTGGELAHYPWPTCGCVETYVNSLEAYEFGDWRNDDR